MSSYLCVKTNNNSVKSYAIKSTANQPYMRVGTGYLPLTSETTTAGGIRVKQGGNNYRIVETYTTTASTQTSSTNTYTYETSRSSQYDTSSTNTYTYNTTRSSQYDTSSTNTYTYNTTRSSQYNTSRESSYTVTNTLTFTQSNTGYPTSTTRASTSYVSSAYFSMYYSVSWNAQRLSETLKLSFIHNSVPEYYAKISQSWEYPQWNSTTQSFATNNSTTQTSSIWGVTYANGATLSESVTILGGGGIHESTEYTTFVSSSTYKNGTYESTFREENSVKKSAIRVTNSVSTAIAGITAFNNISRRNLITFSRQQRFMANLRLGTNLSSTVTRLLYTSQLYTQSVSNTRRSDYTSSRQSQYQTNDKTSTSNWTSSRQSDYTTNDKTSTSNYTSSRQSSYTTNDRTSTSNYTTEITVTSE